MHKVEIPTIVKEQFYIVGQGMRELDALMTIGELAAMGLEEQDLHKNKAPYWPDVFAAVKRYIPRIEDAHQEIEYFFNHGHVSYSLARASWEPLLSSTYERGLVNVGYNDKAVETLRIMFMLQCEKEGITYMCAAKEVQITEKDLIGWVEEKEGVNIAAISHRLAVWMENKVKHVA